jgi:hypothetical protein
LEVSGQPGEAQADQAWYLPPSSTDNGEDVVLVIGNQYLQVGGGLDQMVVAVATGLIANPHRGPFIS